MRLANADQLVVHFESICLRQENAILFGSLLLCRCERPSRRLRLSFQHQIMLPFLLLLNDYKIAYVCAWIRA